VVFDFCTKEIRGCLSGEYIIPGVVAVVVDVITINIFIDSYADIIIIICFGYV